MASLSCPLGFYSQAWLICCHHQVVNMTITVKTDVLVIGGGINGAGIARDLAGRGLSVVAA